MVFKSVRNRVEFTAVLISEGDCSMVLGIKGIGTLCDENVDVPDVN